MKMKQWLPANRRNMRGYRYLCDRKGCGSIYPGVAKRCRDQNGHAQRQSLLQIYPAQRRKPLMDVADGCIGLFVSGKRR
jgi:hypothetical protein